MDAIRNAYLDQLQNKLSKIAQTTAPWISNSDQGNANFLLQKLILALPDNIVAKIDESEYLAVKTTIIDKLLIFTLAEDLKSSDFNTLFSNFVEILVSDIYNIYPQLLEGDADANLQ